MSSGLPQHQAQLDIVQIHVSLALALEILKAKYLLEVITGRPFFTV